MTITKETIDKKIQEINNKLKNNNLTQEEKQLLLDELAKLEEHSEEFDTQSEYYEELEVDTHSENTFIEYESVYFKYCFEGCEKIDDVLERLDALKQQFEQWKIEGHELTQPVDTGYCFIDKVTESDI
jgi:uncharacterized coiled-coil DUF342 family protein